MTLSCPHCQATLNGFAARAWGDTSGRKPSAVMPFLCHECGGFCLLVVPLKRLIIPDAHMLAILQTNRELWNVVEAEQRAIRARKN